MTQEKDSPRRASPATEMGSNKIPNSPKQELRLTPNVPGWFVFEVHPQNGAVPRLPLRYAVFRKPMEVSLAAGRLAKILETRVVVRDMDIPDRVLRDTNPGRDIHIDFDIKKGR